MDKTPPPAAALMTEDALVAACLDVSHTDKKDLNRERRSSKNTPHRGESERNDEVRLTAEDEVAVHRLANLMKNQNKKSNEEENLDDPSLRMSFGRWTLQDKTSWTCATCTYVNQPLHLSCAVCSKAKGSRPSMQKIEEIKRHTSTTELPFVYASDDDDEDEFLKALRKERQKEVVEMQESILSQAALEKSRRSSKSTTSVSESWSTFECFGDEMNITATTSPFIVASSATTNTPPRQLQQLQDDEVNCSTRSFVMDQDILEKIAIRSQGLDIQSEPTSAVESTQEVQPGAFQKKPGAKAVPLPKSPRAAYPKTVRSRRPAITNNTPTPSLPLTTNPLQHHTESPQLSGRKSHEQTRRCQNQHNARSSSLSSSSNDGDEGELDADILQKIARYSLGRDGNETLNTKHSASPSATPKAAIGTGEVDPDILEKIARNSHECDGEATHRNSNVSASASARSNASAGEEEMDDDLLEKIVRRGLERDGEGTIAANRSATASASNTSAESQPKRPGAYQKRPGADLIRNPSIPRNAKEASYASSNTKNARASAATATATTSTANNSQGGPGISAATSTVASGEIKTTTMVGNRRQQPRKKSPTPTSPSKGASIPQIPELNSKIAAVVSERKQRKLDPKARNQENGKPRLAKAAVGLLHGLPFRKGHS